MDLHQFAGRFSGVRWLGDEKFRAHCPCPTHPDGDPECSLLASQSNGRIKIACFGEFGDNADTILAALNLKTIDLDTTIPKAETPAAAFFVNGTQSTVGSNGATPHKRSFGTWQLEVGYQFKGWFGAVPEKQRVLLASSEENTLVEILVEDAKKWIEAHKPPTWPLPEELSESELDEELRRLALSVVKAFRDDYAVPEKEPEEDKISALHLTQLYDVIDQWDRQPWVWDGILPHSSLSLIVGKSETGKSTLIYSLIYAIVTGSDFFGRRCEQGRVLYLAGDPMSEIVAGKTFRALGLTEGVVVIPDALVMHRTGMEQVRAIVKELKPSLVVGDTLAATVDIDVDKYGQSYQAQLPLTRMAREYGPNFLMSHHSQKSAIDSYSVIDSALGSVGVAAVASSRMGTKLYRRKGKKFYTFEMSNLRIGNPIEGEYIVHKLENGLVELAGMWKAETISQDKQLIVDVLARRGEAMAKRTLWAECRPRPKWDPFNDALDALFAEGRLTTEPGRGSAVLYKLK